MRARFLASGALRAAALVCLLGALFVGATAARAQEGTAFVRFLQAASVAPTVDVYLDDAATPIVSAFPFGTLTGYVPWPAGAHKATATPAGKPTSQATLSGTVTAQPGASYTLALVGDAKVDPGVFTFADDNSIASGMGKVRFYHLSTDAGPGSLIVGVTLGDRTVMPSIGFEKASDYFTLKPGAYTFNIKLDNGTTTAPQSLTLDANKVTSVIGVGQVAAKGQTAFHFVTATVAAMPIALPPTGFAPHAANGPESATTTSAYLAIALLLVFCALLRPTARHAFRRRNATDPGGVSHWKAKV